MSEKGQAKSSNARGRGETPAVPQRLSLRPLRPAGFAIAFLQTNLKNRGGF